MTPPWVRWTRPFCSRVSKSRRTVEEETFNSAARVSMSDMPRRARRVWRRECRSAMITWLDPSWFGRLPGGGVAVGAGEVGFDLVAGEGDLLRGGHLLEIGGAV